MCALRPSKLSWLTVNLQLHCPTWVAAVRQEVSCFRAHIITTIVGRSDSAPSSGGSGVGSLCARSSFCPTVCTETSRLPKMLIACSGKSFPSGLLSLPAAFNCDNKAAAWCTTKARCTTSKSKLKSPSPHRTSHPVEFVLLRTLLRGRDLSVL